MAYQLLFYVKSITEEHQTYHSTYSGGEEGIYNILKAIHPKVNVIKRLEFELSNLEFAVQLLHIRTPR